MVSPAAAPWPPGRSRNEEVTDFFRACSGELRGYLIRACGCTEQEADDIVQDSFMAVREQWGHVGGYEKPKAYLYKVAVRRLARVREREAGTYPVDPDVHLVAFPDPVDAFDVADRRAMMMALLRRLPLGQRQVLWLRKGAGFSEAETARILSVKAGTVKSQLHDALARVEELVQKAQGDEWREGLREDGSAGQ